MNSVAIQRVKPNVFLVLPNRDISYFHPLQSLFNKHFAVTRLCGQHLEYRQQLIAGARNANCTLMATTSFQVLKLIDPHLEGTANDNTGTVISFEDSGSQFRIILLPPLVNQFTSNSSLFLIDHFCKKLSLGGTLRKDSFTWDFVVPSNLGTIAARINASSFLVAVDIETNRTDLKVTSVSYTAGFIERVGENTGQDLGSGQDARDNGGIIPDSAGRSDRSVYIYTETYVIQCSPDTYPFCIDAIRVLNSTLPPKVMQNGQYDSTYFLRFNAPLHNWLYDTYTMAHAIYAELPRDLAFISAFYLDNFRFWKDEAGRNLYEYNAKDTHNTFWVWLAQIAHAPEYAFVNYTKKFPSVFPCLSCALDGMDVDTEVMAELHAEESAKRDDYLARLRLLLGEPNFNPGSPKQVMEMYLALGYTKAKGTDSKEMQKFKEASPLYERIADYIHGYRGAVKAIGTYFEVELLNGRLMYALDPSGTETGRLASKSSDFWCGTQIQNIPSYARTMCKADKGWVFGAVDKSQAESYCTGYISEDLNLIQTVTTSPDFHCQNASMFFGIPFDQLFDVLTGKKLNKLIRNIAKRVNHGANYNMGWQVLWDTMGTKEVLMAKQLLKLPAAWTIRRVCEHLLACFDKAYPVIRNQSAGWYGKIVHEVIATGKLVTPTGYTRRTFLKPHKSKLDLNAAVAHKPQSTSSELVELAFKRVWLELQLGKYVGKFRLKAPVHDEIIFIATPDIIEQALEDVAQMMVIPIEINGRLMTIPSTKISGLLWSDLKD